MSLKTSFIAGYDLHPLSIRLRSILTFYEGSFRPSEAPRRSCPVGLHSIDVSVTDSEEITVTKLTTRSLQLNAKHPETFSHHTLSLKPRHYKSMVTAMNLPFRGIETTSCVGPFFWCAYDQDEVNPHLRTSCNQSQNFSKSNTPL